MTHQEIDNQLEEWRENGAAEMADRVPLESAATAEYRKKILLTVSGGANSLMEQEAYRRQREETKGNLEQLTLDGHHGELEERLGLRRK